MEMTCSVPLTAPIKDLKVSIQESDIILPSSSSITDQKSMFLSNLDQLFDLNAQTLHFFTSNPDFSPELVVKRLRGAVSESLGPFNFLAGRLKWNTDLRRLEIDCSDPVGVEFVVAKSEYALVEIGDLVYPHPAFEQLVSSDLKRGDDKLLLSFQVTIFKCGGFSMGTANNHVTFDGMSFKIYLQCLASLAAKKPLTITPYTDRHLLAARSPPRISFQSKLPKPLLTPLDTSDPSYPLHVSVNKLSVDDIAMLKSKVEKPDNKLDENAIGISKPMISSFNIIAALIWKCKVLVNSTLSSSETLDRVSTLGYMVDIRSRIHPPLPQSFIGNAVCVAYATPSTCRELKSCSLRKVVEMVAEGASEINDDNVRCALDHTNTGDNERIFYGECIVSSWCKLGIERVEYPWGKPKYYCPLNYHKKNAVVMFPIMQNEVGSALYNNDCGVNIVAAHCSLEEMNTFQRHFNELLKE